MTNHDFRIKVLDRIFNLINERLTLPNVCKFYVYLDGFEDQMGKYFIETCDDLMFRECWDMNERERVFLDLEKKIIERLKTFCSEWAIDKNEESVRAMRHRKFFHERTAMLTQLAEINKEQGESRCLIPISKS